MNLGYVISVIEQIASRAFDRPYPSKLVINFTYKFIGSPRASILILGFIIIPMMLLTTLLTTLLICGILIYSRDWHLPISGDSSLSGPQKFHQKTTPRIGGLAIFIGLQIGLGVLIYSNSSFTQQCFYILLASLPVFVAGLAEDLTKKVGVKYRLFGAFFSGLAFCWLFEIQAIRLDVIYLDALLQNPLLAIAFLCFAIAGLANAYNIIDGFNGLASMVSIISLIAILCVSIQVNDGLVIELALMTIGAIGGFFLCNYPRGLIFLGDSGAYLIGFLIACLSILLVARHDTISPWFALTVNAYPILETIFTIWRRKFHQGKSVGLPDASHFHSLIYRRVMRFSHNEDDKTHQYLRNAKTSPYLWVLSSLSIVPTLFCWNSTPALIVCAVGFVLLYLYIYRKMVRFKVPGWVNRPPPLK